MSSNYTSNYGHCTPILQNTTYQESGTNETLENLYTNFILQIANWILFFIVKANAWRNQHDIPNLHYDSWISLLYRDAFDLLPPYHIKHARCIHNPLDRTMPFLVMLYYCFFGLTTQNITERCGVDAVQYLTFLKCAVIYNLINTVVISLSVLPANLKGKIRKNESVFMQTMMDNLDIREEQPFAVHICAQTFLMVMGFLVVRCYSSGLFHIKRSKLAKKSVLVKDFSTRAITSERIEKYFKKILPHAEIVDVKIVYKYKYLIKLNTKLEHAEEALALCQLIQCLERRNVYVKDICWCCHFCCHLPCDMYKKDGIEYYTKRIEDLRKQVAVELSHLPAKIFRIAYVTFRRESSAYLAVTRQSQFPKIYEDKNWKISKAEDPSNILWISLSRRGSNYTLKTLLINSAVLFIAVFLTTPPIVLTGMDLHANSSTAKSKGPIFRYIFMFLTWTVSMGISVLVTYSSGFLDFETKSARNKSIMTKTLVFLVFVVIILPSLGLASIGSFFVWTIIEKQATSEVWRCLFLPSNGYFFVSYIMTAGFVGNTIQILRIPEILCILWNVLISKSEAEKVMIRRSCIWDFMYGVQYAHSLLILILVMFYSLLIPIIAPTGWITLTTAFFAIFLATVLGWFISMNPFNLKSIPNYLLMPHRVSPQVPSHYDEECCAFVEDEVYQPYDYRKYVKSMTSTDKYGNLFHASMIDVDLVIENENPDEESDMKL